MTDAPMPADPVVALLPVTQADREAAAGWIGGSPYDVVKAEAEMIRIGQLDNHRLVQAFARHRTPTPASGDVREVNPMADAHVNWVVHQLEAWPTRVDPEKTTNIRYLMEQAARLIRRQPLASPTPDSAVSGSAEGLREALGYDPIDFVAEARGHLVDMPKCIQRDYLRLALEKIERAAKALTEGQQS